MTRATVLNLDRLIELYRNSEDNELALFLGAGVNGGSWAERHLACASWPKLLNALSEYFQRQDRLEAALKADEGDWISVATKLLGDLDRAAHPCDLTGGKAKRLRSSVEHAMI